MKSAAVALIAVLLVPVAGISQEFTGSHTYVNAEWENKIQKLPLILAPTRTGTR